VSAPGTRILFALGARLHMSAAQVEQLSVRELTGWVEFFSVPATEDDGIPDVRELTRDQKRAMFHHG
jgi:hypothetical protein